MKLHHWLSLLLSALCSTACASTAAASHLARLDSVDPADHQFGDLTAFGRAVGNAQVVVLGEQTHGEGKVFSLKVRLAEYLHEKKGFDVLVLESGLFDGKLIEQNSEHGASVLEQAPGNLFFAYSKSREVRPLFAYIDAQRKAGTPLTLATFDSQQSGKLSQALLVDRLGAYLKASGSVLPDTPEWKLFHERTDALLQFQRAEPTPEEQQAYFQFSDQLAQCLSVVDKPELQAEAPYWRRVLASVRSQASRFWTTHGDFAADAEMREEAGADNLAWLFQQAYPGHKFIVWTHDGHGQKSPLYATMKGSMQRVREKLPQLRFYHAYFTGYSGQFVDYQNGSLVTVGEHDPASLETQLHAAGIRQGFLDLQSAGASVAGRRLDGYDRTFPSNHPLLPEFTDGVFYLDEIRPSVREKGFED